jgi:hypothetical protein
MLLISCLWLTGLIADRALLAVDTLRFTGFA